METLTKTQKQWVERKLHEFYDNEFEKRDAAVKEYTAGELKRYLEGYSKSVQAKMRVIAETEQFTEEEFISIVKEIVHKRGSKLEGIYINKLNNEISEKVKQYSKELKEKMREVQECNEHL